VLSVDYDICHRRNRFSLCYQWIMIFVIGETDPPCYQWIMIFVIGETDSPCAISGL
jgi:hypothetical protein